MGDYIEVTERTLEDAITTACQKLSVTSDRLDYNVIQEGSNGFLGIGAKPAIIRARIKEVKLFDDAEHEASLKEAAEMAVNAVKKAGEESFKAFQSGEKISNAELKAEEEARKAAEKAAAEAKKAEKEAERAAKAAAEAAKREAEKAERAARGESEEDDRDRRGGRSRDGRRGRRHGDRGRDRDRRPRSEEFEETYGTAAEFGDFGGEEEAVIEEVPARQEKDAIPEEKQLTDEHIAEVEEKAENFLSDVFGAMKMPVKTSYSFNKKWNTLTIDIEGDEMGVLIGKRGQTLDSLQYLVSLVVNRDEEMYIHVKTDTENYRARRKQTLENLARNIAYKVKRTRRPVELEPMNPYERRIIHSALQRDKYVTTHSEGEEPYRKVVVTLKHER